MANIMIVDDSSIIRRSLRDILHQMGHQVVAEAEDGSAAVELYKQRSVDLVTMDIQMPGMSGIDTVRQLREFDPQAVIVMISSLEQRNMVFDAIKAGAKHYVIKPFTEDKVREVIDGILGHQPAQPAAAAEAKPEPAAKKREPYRLENLHVTALPFELVWKEDRVVLIVQKHINGLNIRHLYLCVQGLMYMRNAKYVIELWEQIVDPEGEQLLLDFVTFVRARRGTIAIVAQDVHVYTVMKSKLGSGVYKSHADMEW